MSERARALEQAREWQAIAYGDRPETWAALDYYRELGWPVDSNKFPERERVEGRIFAFMSGYREALKAAVDHPPPSGASPQAETSTNVRALTVHICEDCLNLRGEMCHEPGCRFCWRTMAEVAEYLDVLLIRPRIDGVSVLVDEGTALPTSVSPVEPEPPTNPPCARCGHALSAHRPEFGACDGRDRPCACPEYQVPTAVEAERDKAIDEQIATLTADCAAWEAENEGLLAKVRAAKVDCACELDNRGDVCMVHVPAVIAQKERADRAEAERDAKSRLIAELEGEAKDLKYHPISGIYAIEAERDRLKAALSKADEALKRITAGQEDCGDPGVECPLHDAHKAWHPVSEALAMIAALTPQGQSTDGETR